jgi:hypothetical protein
MGKKTRSKKRHQKEWVRATPKVFDAGPIRIERFGRFTRFQNTSSPDQHANLLKQLAEVNETTAGDLEKAVPLSPPEMA